MKRITIFMFCVITNTLVFSQIMPLKTQPLIWLKADNAGSNNNNWQDISGNNLSAFTSNNQYKNDTMLFNYNTSFLFDSLSLPFTINYKPRKTENLTVLTVYKASHQQIESGLWYIKLDTAKNVKLTTQRIGSVKSELKYTDTTQTKPICCYVVQIVCRFTGKWLNT